MEESKIDDNNNVSINVVDKNNLACKNLVVGGGGTLLYAYYGAIDELFTNDDISKIKNCIGTSAGAIISMMIAVGATKEYIKQKIDEFDIKTASDHSFFASVNIYSIINHLGYNKGKVALHWIEKILNELTNNKNLTFADVYNRFGRNLVVTGCNISRNTFSYFNRLSHPDMKVAHAVRISMSVPFFFRPFKYNGDIYIDGGTTLNYPIAFVLTDMFKLLNEYNEDMIGCGFTDKMVDVDTAISNIYDLDVNTFDDVSKKYILEHTIGMKTFNKRTLNYIKPGKKYDKHVDFKLLDYMGAVLNMLTDATLRDHIDENMWDRTIKIDNTDYNSVDFNITPEIINTMIKLGRFSAQQFLNPSGDALKFRIDDSNTVSNNQSKSKDKGKDKAKKSKDDKQLSTIYDVGSEAEHESTITISTISKSVMNTNTKQIQ